MDRKVVLITDPGIDDAYALALALYDPHIDVLAVAATAGNVSAEQATRNVHALIEHFDPPKWPRIGEAIPVDYKLDGMQINGPGGLGGVELPCVRLHHPHPAAKVIVDQVRNFPGDVSIVALGPLTALAAALDRDLELPKLVRQIIIIGGTWHEAGTASAVAEFNFLCDAASARQVLKSGAPITLIPLDTTHKALFSPAELSSLPSGWSPAGQLLRKIVPYGVGATARQFAIEGFYLHDVLGVAAVALPSAFNTKPMTVDVETQGELTQGMMVVDTRLAKKTSNIELAIDVDMKAIRNYMARVFSTLSDEEE